MAASSASLLSGGASAAFVEGDDPALAREAAEARATFGSLQASASAAREAVRVLADEISRATAQLIKDFELWFAATHGGRPPVTATLAAASEQPQQQRQRPQQQQRASSSGSDEDVHLYDGVASSRSATLASPGPFGSSGRTSAGAGGGYGAPASPLRLAGMASMMPGGASGGADWTSGLGGVGDGLDAGEAFAAMEVARVAAQDPDSVAFFNATRKLRQHRGAAGAGGSPGGGLSPPRSRRLVA